MSLIFSQTIPKFASISSKLPNCIYIEHKFYFISTPFHMPRICGAENVGNVNKFIILMSKESFRSSFLWCFDDEKYSPNRKFSLTEFFCYFDVSIRIFILLKRRRNLNIFHRVSILCSPNPWTRMTYRRQIALPFRIFCVQKRDVIWFSEKIELNMM